MTAFPPGFAHYPLYFDAVQQAEILNAVSAAAKIAPFYQPRMPRTCAPISVVMSNFGALGWVAEVSGYRYDPVHPKTGAPWPAIPPLLDELWDAVTDWPERAEACLINWYRQEAHGGAGAKMGMHVDADEHAVNAPIVSVSLGDPAMYRIGGPSRGGPTKGIKLMSGDVVVLSGEARRCYHGVSKVYYGETALVPKGGRINLTMRRVMP